MIYRFGEFELDVDRFELRRGGALLEVQPRVLEVLLYLVEHRERLVARAELLAAVWAGTRVEEASLYRAIAIGRRLLGEAAGAADPIRTLQGKGYRFAAEVTTLEPGVRSAATALPGRADALATLDQALERARAGERQLVVVSGEAGIGKTSLLAAFSAELGPARDIAYTAGQCLEPLESDPYSPLLEAVGRLCRRTGSDAVETLRSRAPSWLAQLPAFGAEGERGELAGRSKGATRERLTEELADAFEDLAARRPLVLVLEDLHWCDRATLGLLAALAQRPEPARLLVVATVRTGEPAAAAGPLWKLLAELKGKRRCQELALRPLAVGEVGEVLGARLGGETPPAGAARWLAERSAGNPLFVHHLIDFALERRLLGSAAGSASGEPTLDGDEGVPGNLRELIESQLDALGPANLALLEAASAAGAEFTAAEAAAATEAEAGAVEDACDELARRSLFLARAGVSEWRDGTLAARFRFRHVLHREVLYARLAPARRRAMHLRIGRRLEAGAAGASAEIALSLARHFDQGGDAAAAVRHYASCVETAARRHAGHEAKELAERGLTLLPRLAEGERDAAELALRFALAPALPAALGLTDPALDANLARAQQLCERTGDGERRLAVLWSRCYARYQAGEAEQALAFAEQLLDAAQTLGRPAFEVLARDALAISHHKLCRFAESERHAEAALALYDPARHGELAGWIGQDVGVDAAITSAFNLWYLGRPGAAGARIDEAVERARRSGHAYSLVLALCYAAAFHVMSEEWPRAREQAEQALERARAERLPALRAFAELMRGASLPKQADRLGAMMGALQGMPSGGEDAARATGTTGVRALFVGALAELGLRDLALGELANAFEAAVRSGEPHHVPGLHVLRAGLLEDDAEAGRELETALAAAQDLGLRMAELQAATELARWRARCGRGAEARALLEPRVGALAGEPDVPLLQRARTLLAELGAG